VWHHNGSLLLPLFRLRRRLRVVLGRVAWPSVNPLLHQSELMMGAAGTNVTLHFFIHWTIAGKSFQLDSDPTQIKGYWSVIREGDDLKIRMLSPYVTPADAKPSYNRASSACYRPGF
jgi:hypothetical protein